MVDSEGAHTSTRVAPLAAWISCCTADEDRPRGRIVLPDRVRPTLVPCPCPVPLVRHEAPMVAGKMDPTAGPNGWTQRRRSVGSSASSRHGLGALGEGCPRRVGVGAKGRGQASQGKLANQLVRHKTLKMADKLVSGGTQGHLRLISSERMDGMGRNQQHRTRFSGLGSCAISGTNPSLPLTPLTRFSSGQPLGHRANLHRVRIPLKVQGIPDLQRGIRTGVAWIRLGT